MDLYNAGRLFANVIGISLLGVGSYCFFKLDSSVIGTEKYCNTPQKGKNSRSEHTGCRDQFDSSRRLYLSMILAGTTALVFANIRQIEFSIFGCKDCASEKIRDLFTSSGRSL